MFSKLFKKREDSLLEIYTRLETKNNITKYNIKNIFNLIKKIKIISYIKNKKLNIKIKSIPSHFTYKNKKKKKEIRMDFVVTALIISVQELNKEIYKLNHEIEALKS